MRVGVVNSSFDRFAVPQDPNIGPEEHFEQLRRFADGVLPHL